MKLLKELCSIIAPSGNERAMKEFLMKYIEDNMSRWKIKPAIFHGEDFQDCIVLVFGRPRTAGFAHMDSIGFTVRYNNQLVKIGSPVADDGIMLKGMHRGEEIEYPIALEDKSITIKAPVQIDRGTE